MASQSLVNLYNLAISALGSRTLVDSPEEMSREAELCNLWYDNVRDQVLRAAPWPSCRQTRRLPVRVERDYGQDWVETDPEGGNRFVYGLPDDYLQPIYLQGWGQFIVGNYDQQPSLTTNVENAVLTYTSRTIEIPQWDNDLYMAVAQALCAAISLPLHGKMPRKQEAIQMANMLIAQAQVRTANEMNVQYDHIPDWLTCRNVGAMYPNKFIYPNGPMLSFVTLT